MLRYCQKARKEGNTARFEAQRVFGLRKPIPKGAALAGYKHKVIRAVLRKRFPLGTCFMDRNVLAFFIFDALPLNTQVSVLTFRQAHLPEDGRTVFPISSDYINSFKHLWQPRQANNTDWLIQRADSTNLPPEDSPDNYTEEDVVLAILSCAPGGDAFDPTRPTTTSTVMSRLPETLRQWVWKQGMVVDVLKRHPQHFQVLDNERFLWMSLAKTAAPLAEEKNKSE